ncbi:aldo/keto reductase [Zafaria sp. Z1313]|uniref:aldo/keto reductase n=1 Tax=Zafaria sp. Z1313 TaxID=3423202 RepID=UPI003D30346B
MTQRVLGDATVRPIGLGCMNLSHGYSNFPSPRDGAHLLREALDAGIDHLDTATLYGGGRNEELVGAAVADRCREFFLASKCGLELSGGKARIDGRPQTIRRQAEESLSNLRTDFIDLYYLHRLDPDVPIEDSVGAMSELVQEGMIGAIGLSEVSVATLRRAHGVHPIAAVQNEYSLWTRNPELGMLDACRELGTTFVAFSPLGRAFLTGTLTDPAALPPGDMRHHMPRFSAENYPRNLALLDGVRAVADRVGASLAQIALAWVVAQGEHVVAIPGTTSLEHLRENLGAEEVVLDAATLAELDALVNQDTVHGHRYNAAQQATIDSEDFPSAQDPAGAARAG